MTISVSHVDANVPFFYVNHFFKISQLETEDLRQNIERQIPQTRTRCERVDGFGHNAVLPGFKPLHPLPFLRLGLKLTVALLHFLLLLISLKNQRRNSQVSQACKQVRGKLTIVIIPSYLIYLSNQTVRNHLSSASLTTFDEARRCC